LVAPSTSALLTQWDWEPSVLIGLLLLTAGYFYAVGPLRRQHSLGPPVTRRQQTWFILSVLILIVSLLSPLDDISDRYLFSVHMVQHLLLASVWPPLLLLALPDWLVRPIFRRPALGGLLSFFTYPGMAILLFNADIIVWHLPVLYDLTLSNETVHILEHLSFMAFGLLNWWPLLSPIREQRLSYPLQMLYLFADGMFMMVLGILFTFSPIVFYTAYQSAPRLWGISVLNDQQLGGLIMWYPGNIPYAIALVTAFYRWFDAGQDSLAPQDEPTWPEQQAIPSQASRIGSSTGVEPQ
jgi:putative membrane protein